MDGPPRGGCGRGGLRAGRRREVDDLALREGGRLSRRIGGSVRLVLSDWFRWPDTVSFWPGSDNPNLYNDKPEGFRLDIRTTYENKFLGQGMPIHYLRFRFS